MKIFTKKFQPIQYINKTPYLIHAIFAIEDVKNTTDWKNYLGCTTAFKNNREGVYYFCEEIESVEFEEITE